MPQLQKKILLPIVIIGSAILIAVVLFINRPQPEQADITKRTLLINVAEVVKEDIQISVRAQGTVMPRTSTSLISEVSGRIVEVSNKFIVGGYFVKDDVLLRIDPRDYVSELKRAEAEVASAKSDLATEQGTAEVAYQDWIKYRSSVKRSESATQLALRKPQLAKAQAELDAAVAKLEHARDQLDRTIIRAPYDGIIKAKHVDFGQYVTTGVLLADSFAIDKAELRLPLPANKLDYLQLPSLANHSGEQQATVTLFAKSGDTVQQWQANLVRTEAVFDERSRVLFAVAEIKDPYGIYSENPEHNELRMGTFVDANIDGKVINDLIALPRYLLRPGNQLWVVDEQMRLQNRQVSVLRTEGTEIYVTSGLNEGELVCLSSIGGAVPGTQVRIAEKIPTNFSAEKPVMPETPVEQGEGLNLAPAKPQTTEPNSVNETTVLQDQPA